MICGIRRSPLSILYVCNLICALVSTSEKAGARMEKEIYFGYSPPVYEVLHTYVVHVVLRMEFIHGSKRLEGKNSVCRSRGKLCMSIDGLSGLQQVGGGGNGTILTRRFRDCIHKVRDR